MKTIYLMRHGQTLFNVQHKIQGWCDSPLTEVGKEQAKIAGKWFENQGIVLDKAYCSTSERCSDTLELITDLPYKRMKSLKEWNFGKMEGEGEHLNPPFPYLNWFKENAGGESQEEVVARINEAMKEIVQDDFTNALVVSHGAACANFIRSHEDTNKEHYRW
ncbi:MAG: histidine phosphatase family protein [Bacillota bacterium]|nr:histidine phosphatase family protein [Bacillota bacterium]